jgi:hypothetical protein
MQENDKMEISPKKRARSGGNHQFATIARSRDTSAESVQRGLQMKPQHTPQRTRHNNLPSKMTSISSSKTRYLCAPMTKSLMTKQWRKKWFTVLHTICPKKQTTPTQSPLRKPPKTMTKLKQKPQLKETSQHLPLEGKTGAKTRLTRKPPLVTMKETLVRKRNNPPHRQIQALPIPVEQPKNLTPPKSAQESNPESTKQTKNSRKMRMSHKADKDLSLKKHATNQGKLSKTMKIPLTNQT